MNTPAFFPANPAPPAPSAFPEAHPAQMPGDRSSLKSFSNALKEAASAKEGAPKSATASAKSREAVGSRSDRNDEQDSSEPKVPSVPKDNDRGDGSVMDRTTMESMASLFAAVVPAPLPVTVAMSGGSGAEATGEVASAPVDPLATMDASLITATGQSGNQVASSTVLAATTPLAAEANAALLQNLPGQKPVADLVKPLDQKQEQNILTRTATEAEAATTQAAKSATISLDSAKVEKMVETTQSTPMAEKVVAETPLISKAVEMRNGTPVAQMEGDMRKTAKRNETVETAEQKLPVGGNSFSVSAEKVVPLAGVSIESRSRNGAYSTLSDSLAAGLNLPAVSVSFTESTAKEISAAPAGVTPAERVLGLVAAEIGRFKQMKLESMAVVLRPDPHTEISLSLKMNEGRVEAQAICERGDFSALSAQWGQLQQSLAGQRIELAPLREANSQNGNPDQSFSRNFAQSQGQSQRDSQRREEKPKLAFAEQFAPFRSTDRTTKTAPRPVVTASDGRRLETWA